MTTILLFFEKASELYNQIFADWLYIHYAVRTLILLLILWMLVYGAAQVFHYILAPLAVLFFYHVLFRAWHFFIIESLQEWIYIHYYAEDKPFLQALYLSLCDRIKYNRLKLAHTRYTGIIYRGRVQKITARLMVITLVIITLWTAAFGLYNEYGSVSGRLSAGTHGAAGGSGPGGGTDNSGATGGDAGTGEDENPGDGTGNGAGNGFASASAGQTVTIEDGAALYGQRINPTVWPENAEIIFVLNSYGIGGSNVRDLPSVSEGTPVEVVRGDVQLTYLGEYTRDESNADAYWLKVRTPSGTEGYINSTLLSWL